MDVKGQRKPRGRRPSTAEAPAPRAANRRRAKPGATEAGPSKGSGPEAEEVPETTPAGGEPPAAAAPEGEPDVPARQDRESTRPSSPDASGGEEDGEEDGGPRTAVLPVLPPDEPEEADAEAAGEAAAVGRPGGREAESRRERRAREQAEEAEAIEAAALGAGPGLSRRQRRAEKRAERDRRKAGQDRPAEAPAGPEAPAAGPEAAPAATPGEPPTDGEPSRARPEAAGVPRVAAPRAGAVRTPAGAGGLGQREGEGFFEPAPPPPPSGRPRPTTTGPAGRRPPGRQIDRAKIRRQRRRRRRTIIGTTILLIFTNLVVGGAYAYFQWRLDQINRLDVPGLADDVPGAVMNVLLVGSDSRERLTGEAAAQAGKDQVEGQRSDTIMVLHVDPRQRRAAILSVPRDLYVPIAGTPESDRVNTAFATGGPERLITTLVNIGIQVNHYAEVDFVGFKEIVDAVGGVTVYLSHWARDFTSGLDIPRTGCVDLNGSEALAYVRSRNFESLVDGRWVPDPRGDLGRIERQQDFVRKVMKKAVRTGIGDPLTLNRLIGIGVRNLTVDATMSTSDITTVARRFRSVDPESVETLVLPTTPQRIEGQDVLVLEQDEAQDEIAKINGLAPIGPPTTQPAPAAPTPGAPGGLPFRLADVRVQVLNGNGVKGSATTAGDALKTAGFTVVGTGDAAIAPRTLIRHRPAQQVQAQIIQNGLETGAQLREDPTLRNADVVLALGTDYKGFKPVGTPAPGASAPQTPAPTVPKPPC